MKFLNRGRVRVVRGSKECPMVLIVLELGWHICCDITFSFKFEILCFERSCEGMAHDFAFSTKILGIADVITSKEVQSLTMSNKNWRSYCDWFALLFEAEIGIRPVNDPLSDI